MWRLCVFTRRRAAVAFSTCTRFVSSLTPAGAAPETFAPQPNAAVAADSVAPEVFAPVAAASSDNNCAEEVEDYQDACSTHADKITRRCEHPPVDAVEILMAMANNLRNTLKVKTISSAAESGSGGEKSGETPDSDKVTGAAPPCFKALNLIKTLRAYIRSEERLAQLCRSKAPMVRRHFLAIRSRRKCLPPLQREIILTEVARVVEQREVPLSEVMRLLRPRWPDHMMDVTGSRNHVFLQRSARAWIAELLQAGKVSPEEARSLLCNCPQLFTAHLTLMSSTMECALRDINSLQSPEPLIKLMWAVNDAGTHAPNHFWTRVVGRLAQLNRSLRDSLGDSLQQGRSSNGAGGAAAEGKTGEHYNDTNNEERKNINEKNGVVSREAVGHVFTGLTTRQLFRVVRVLRKEKWCGDVSTIYDFVDKALKNIVFEVEALGACDRNPPGQRVTRQLVLQRVKKSSDLLPTELLSLLSIAGELGVDFHSSLARISDFLLCPMALYLDREQLLELTLFVRRTRCDSPQLVQAIADEIVRRGVNYPSSLSLSKAALRTSLQRQALLSQLTLTPLVDHVISLCRTYGWSMRASQLLGWAELLYDLSRRYAPTSSIGVNVRSCVELLAAPLRAMLSSGVVPLPIISRFLEVTVILGMRGKPLQYEGAIKLWEERNAAVAARTAFANRVLREGGVLSAGTITCDLEEVYDSEEGDEIHSHPVGELCRAAREVYDELIYMYELHMIMQNHTTRDEMRRVAETFGRVGLYNMVVGAAAMARVHLQPHATSSSAGGGDGTLRAPVNGESVTPPRTLPAWLERQVNLVVVERIRRAKITAASSDDDVLRLFGQRRCNASKVHTFLKLLSEETPLFLLRQQRVVWEFAAELSRRFGDEEDRRLVGTLLAKALY
uniref:Uncharacterized protein TCIL3000_8_8330 n=1 Tax=Trypanosoma congolense (strain IL3000) TaxID=1068625 RepID=G0UT90_TRYCI|nr:unnamed protein product [Trypanosoma congolense IL3000]